MRTLIVHITVLIQILHGTGGLYFNILGSERKCFLEDLPAETPAIVSYKVKQLDNDLKTFTDPSQHFGMHVDINSPDENILLSRVYGSEGRVAFTSSMSGVHLICLSSNSSTWFSNIQLQVHFAIRVGENAVEYGTVAKKEKLTEMQLRIRQLIDQVEHILNEQNYQRTREELFRHTSDSTNSHVLWWALIQTIVVISIGIWQMRHLKNFFLLKKLV